MRNLINFILKNVHWLLFFFLIFISIFLLVRNNEFQRSKYLSVFQEVAGRVYSVSNAVESYMNLKTANSDLIERVAVLEEEVRIYQKELEGLSKLKIDTGVDFGQSYISQYSFIKAKVVHNQTSKAENYVTLNKGASDGIESDMGVLSPRGIVGVVMKVSSHYSIVIPVLNPKFRLSCKIKGSGYFGPLIWDGKDPRYTFLEELPRHATYNDGDTIVTSGHSTIFPEGIPVGIIEDSSQYRNDEYNSLKIRLFTDFSTLNEVLIVKNALKEEQKNIEKGIIN